MAQTTIDLTGLKGLAPRYYGDKPYASSSPNLRYFGAEGQMAEGIYNPISELGYMNPANNTTKAVSGTTSYLLTSAIVAYRPTDIESSTDLIFFSDEASVTDAQGQILQLDTYADTSLANTQTIPYWATNEAMYVQDMIMYQIGGRRQIFLALKNNDASQPNPIGILTANGSTLDEDWSVNTVSGGAETNTEGDARMKFVKADNGLLYVLDCNTVHQIDGSSTGGENGTYTKSVLLFEGSTAPLDSSSDRVTELVDGVDNRGRVWIGLHINNQNESGNTYDYDGNAIPLDVGIFVWDKASSVASSQDFIYIDGAREMYSMHRLRGNVCCFTSSTDGYTQLRVWNGSEMKVVQTLGKNANPRYRRHSLYEAGSYIMWLGADGKIYCYGAIEEGLKDALYIIGDMTNHVTTNEAYSESGVFVCANKTETVTSGNNPETLAFYISFSDTGGNHLKKWYPFGVNSIASNAQTGEQGNVYSLVHQLPTLSNVGDIIIRCAPTSTGSTTIATIKYYFNNASSPSMTKTITKTDASKGYVMHQINKQNVNNVQIEIEWSTTETLSTDTFRPYVAIVDYEPTGSRG